jgi:hypothetical protein
VVAVYDTRESNRLVSEHVALSLAHLKLHRKEDRTLKISERLTDVLSILDNLRDGIDDSLTTTPNILNNLKEFSETGLNELIENIEAIRDDAHDLEIED